MAKQAIETDPVEKNCEVIGWQAKFYETPLSKHKADLIKTIEKAKKDYPKITKLYFYTNKEWGRTNRGKSPQGLLDSENKTHELGIKIKWNTASFFESEFVALENENISKHFFRQDKSIFDQIKERQGHAENILDDIRTSVKFDNQEIEIDRKDILKELKDELHQIVILSSVGGVGKTAVIKKLKNLFWGNRKTEKSENILSESESYKDKDEDEDEGEGEGGGGGGGGAFNSGIEDSKKENITKKKKGHGKNGVSAYVGAEVVYISHKKLKNGQLCPDCEGAKIYKYKDGIEIRIKGSPPLKAFVYKLEKFRCALCGKIFTAELPEEAGEDKYDTEAGSIISLLKYGSLPIAFVARYLGNPALVVCIYNSKALLTPLSRCMPPTRFD